MPAGCKTGDNGLMLCGCEQAAYRLVLLTSSKMQATSSCSILSGRVCVQQHARL